jgi:hypothetical protein
VGEDPLFVYVRSARKLRRDSDRRKDGERYIFDSLDSRNVIMGYTSRVFCLHYVIVEAHPIAHGQPQRLKLFDPLQ